MSILTHSPAIVRDGLVLCLDAGAVRSYPGTGPELVSNGNFESSFTNYWVIRPAQDGGNQVLTQDSSIVKSGTYSAKIVVGGSNPNYDGFRGDSSGHFTLTNGKRYLLSFDVYPVNDTGIDAYIVAGSTYCGTNVTGLTQGAWNNVELFIDVTATSSSSFVEFQTGSLWGDGTWYFDNVSVREVLWNDLSGNFNNGTLVNAPTFSAESGAGGTRSFDFDGSSDKVTFGDIALNLSTGATMAFWCEHLDNTNGAVLGSDDSCCHSYIQPHENGTIYFESSDDSNTATGAMSGTDGFHYYVVSVTGYTATIYEDGVDITTDSSLSSANVTFNYIGTTGVKWFNGKVAIVHLYNRALTAAEIQQNYRTHKGRFGR
jgi:hypothetical protein